MSLGYLDDTGPPNAVIYGCSGAALTGEERRFFTEVRPTGFILFERNCLNPDQVLRLVTELKEITGRAGTPVLIDQEGGRVQRLKPPNWPARPAAASFQALALHDPALAGEAVRLNAELIATELLDIGITVDCAPVLDVPAPGSHDIIGDRAFGDDPDTVAALGLAAAEGFLSRGVVPVIKHIPGHGRAAADSHHDLPVVAAAAAELEKTDFPPFRALGHMPWAMTAHVVYTALDKDNPATTSEKVIRDTIRGTLGFDGVLISDDIGMQALVGTYPERATAALAAGCDLVLHCSGDMAEMKDTATGVGPLTGDTVARLARGEAMREAMGQAARGGMGRAGADWDAAVARARLDDILEAAP